MKALVKLIDGQGFTQLVLTPTGKVSRIPGDIGECDIGANIETYQYLRNLAITNVWHLEVQATDMQGIK